MCKKINFLFFFTVLIIELVIGLVLFRSYPLISMLFLGEGANSLLYSDFNSFLWLVSPYLILLFNFSCYLRAKSNEDIRRLTTYIVISISYAILITGFVIFWGIKYHFNI